MRFKSDGTVYPDPKQLLQQCFTNGSPDFPPSSASVAGSLEEFFLNDKFKVTPWLTFIAGIRQSHFTADIGENEVDPRLGLAIKVPRIHWVLHALYGHFYQPPPLLTATGPLLNLANSQNLTFAPLHGERDEEYQFGVTISFPRLGTRCRPFLNHRAKLARSQQHRRIRPVLATHLVSSLDRELGTHAALAATLEPWPVPSLLCESNPQGPFTGGLICPNPAPPGCEPPPGYAPVDHDQRNTLNLGFNANLPWQSFAAMNMHYGSGFTNGMPEAQYPGNYLPSHTTFDVSVGKSLREKYSLAVNALNVGNRRVLLDNSLTFGGFHYNDPREIYAEFRYRFHY